MTLTELRYDFPAATPETWHKHRNGGGWVENTAWVDATAKVGSNAIVWGNARVLDNACVLDYAQVHNNAWVCSNAQVCGAASISDSAVIYGDAKVDGSVCVSGTARVGGTTHLSGLVRVAGDARIVDGEWTTSPLHIQGSSYSLTNAKPGYIQIGCELHTYKQWLRLGPKLAKEARFTEKEIEEYMAYIHLFQRVGK